MFSKVSAQYIILVKLVPPSLPLEMRFGLPPSLLAALPFNIACKPILLSDPARAVLHSARSAVEISEVL